jgi:hypothetical protein
LQFIDSVLERSSFAARRSDHAGARVRPCLASIHDQSCATTFIGHALGSRAEKAIRHPCARSSEHNQVRTPIPCNTDDGLLRVANPNGYCRTQPGGGPFSHAPFESTACEIGLSTGDAQRQLAVNNVQQQELCVANLSQPQCLLQGSIGTSPEVSRAHHPE